MNYLGKKTRLKNFILENMFLYLNNDMHNATFCDLFAGTGTVGNLVKPYVKKIVANDIEDYAYVLNKCYIESQKIADVSFLNTIKPINGLIYNNYCSPSDRLYFSDANGKKIDGIRKELNLYKHTKEYYIYMTSLLEAVDKIQNTTGLYAAFLKNLKHTAKNDITLVKPDITIIKEQKNLVYNKDARVLIKEIEGDILYIDPPYNRRQYGTNYHLLNTIVNYKLPYRMNKITGSPKDYFKSKWGYHNTVKEEFNYIIANAEFTHIFVSYSNEGLMSIEYILDILKKYGEVFVSSHSLNTYKADKKRNNKSHTVTEYLFYLRKVK